MHQRRRTLGLVRSAATLLAVLALASACSASSDSGSSPSTSETSAGSTSPTASDKVSIAVFNQYPPAEYVKDGKLTGWMIDLLGPLSEKSGLKFDVTQVSNFSTIIPGIQSGRFDAAAAAITVTNERLKTLDFVTTDRVGTGFATKAGSGLTISKPIDVCGHSVSALTGSVYEPQMKSINKECASGGDGAASISLFPDTSAAVLAVQNGRTDAVIGSFAEIANAVKESAGLKLQPYQFAQLPEAIGFPKGSPYSKRILDAMNALIDDGTYAQLLEQYGMSGVAVAKSELNPAVD
jgi:polar amino acid transport system substrate-binding protein